MAGLVVLFTSNCRSLPPPRASVSSRQPRLAPAAVCFSGWPLRRRARGVSVVAGAGPSSSSYVFAFVFPFSLLAITIFASIRIADKLDKDFLEELEVNEAAREAFEGEDPDILLEEEPVLPRTRNRPKREA